MATFLSYHDLQQQGILYSEAHALQYLINVGILRPHQYCGECQTYMELKSCPTARYSDGYNWACPDDIHLLSVRADSVLHRRKIVIEGFISAGSRRVQLACPSLLFVQTLPGPCPNLARTLPARTLPQPCFLPGPCPDLARTLLKTLPQPCPNLA